ncbi:hypothetical protein [Alsobacter soli]|uniref:hypothetical protein n=1 Tax=Alsobacter soli TaxID=2109933 RepID=UPI000D07BED9|nr:hypothetical protein [Alsobacter soli]
MNYSRWLPSSYSGGYRLPGLISERIRIMLASFKNKEAAFKLFVFLARFHTGWRSGMRRMTIDRRKLAGHPALKLTEDQIKGAIKTLRAAFLLEQIPYAEAYADGLCRNPGEPQMRAAWYAFSAEIAALFPSHGRAQKTAQPSTPNTEMNGPVRGHLGEEKPKPVKEPQPADQAEEETGLYRGVPPHVEPWMMRKRPEPVPDEHYWGAIMSDIRAIFSPTDLTRAINAFRDPARRSEVIAAERERLGGGLEHAMLMLTDLMFEEG